MVNVKGVLKGGKALLQQWVEFTAFEVFGLNLQDVCDIFCSNLCQKFISLEFGKVRRHGAFQYHRIFPP